MRIAGGENCRSCSWRKEGFVCELGEHDLQAFDDLSVAAAYPENAVLYSEGETPRGLIVVCHGSVQITMSSCERKTLVSRIAAAGEAAGLTSTITGNPYKTTASTLAPSQIRFVRRDHFFTLLKVNRFAFNILRQLGRECDDHVDRIATIGLSSSAAQKLAELLLRWHCSGRESHERLRMTHQQIAQIIGTSRETVARLLYDFRDRGFVTLANSTVTIRDEAALRRAVDA